MPDQYISLLCLAESLQILGTVRRTHKQVASVARLLPMLVHPPPGQILLHLDYLTVGVLGTN